MIDHESHLIDVLDRILDKGIVVDQWIRLAANGAQLEPIAVNAANIRVETDDLSHLFAYWRRDLWTK